MQRPYRPDTPVLQGAAEIGAVMEAWMQSKPPVYDFVSADGVAHSVWVIDSRETIDRLMKLFKGIDSLYIADGHHRCEAAARVCLEKREGGYRGDEEFNFFLGVIFPHSRLQILDYNRVVKDLNGLSKEEFLQRISSGGGKGPAFEIKPVEGPKAYRPKQRHHMGMYLDGRWYELKAVPGTWNQVTRGMPDVHTAEQPIETGIALRTPGPTQGLNSWAG